MDDLATATLSAKLRKPSQVRVADIDNPSRRQMLRVALQGAAAPAACYLLARATGEAHAAVESPGRAETTAQRHSSATHARIVRDFKDPYIELLRLLHQAAEIEHALMIQYLYATFSIKPAYAAVAGAGAPSATDLLGVAIQEMQHLGKVNQLLVALGAAPTLIREDFPYEPDIYPFRFNLEPLSRASVAKYTWTEAPIGATDIRNARSADERAFCHDLERALGPGNRPNYVGTLYDTVITGVEELIATKDASLPNLKPWVEALHHIKDEGEVGHYPFFKSVFLGTHKGFGTGHNVWDHSQTDPLYPAYRLPVNPTAYLGHEHQMHDPQARGLAWLGDLHYWIVLTLLSMGYSTGSQEHIGLAKAHMMGAFWSLARKLASLGTGMPFDPLGLGYAPGVTRQSNTRLLSRLLDETDKFEKRLGATLPSDYPVDCCRGTQSALAQLAARTHTARAPSLPWDDGLA